ncbi:MAG: aspartyl/asparaginyl beta-hydroxylase domain-containing protein [Acidobacteriota bacterium]|nr:aspartyl/asparaginyl beta-hydroxylase domain-containing protein [Acidobacteriota bacterium]
MALSTAGKSLRERTVDWTVAGGERVLAPIERYIGRRSLVGDSAYFEPGQFPWIASMEENWEVIRAELEPLLAERDALPSFQEISRDQVEITDDDRWKTLFLYGYGFKTDLGTQLCPRTTELVEQIPGMVTAMFSILSPRKHIPAHRGPYKGVLRYHLGLIVPARWEDCRIRVGSELRAWEAGRSMVFDDTFEHEVFNETDELRAVLFLDVLRPLPRPYNEINRLIVKAIGVSPFVQDARRNQRAWEARFLAGRRERAAAPAA